MAALGSRVRRLSNNLVPARDTVLDGRAFPPRGLIQVAAGLADAGAETALASSCVADPNMSGATDRVLAAAGRALDRK